MTPFPCLFRSHEGLFLQYLPWEPRSISRNNIEAPPMHTPPPPEILTLRVVHTQPPAVHQLQFRVSYPCSGFYRGFQSQVSAPISHDPLCFPVWILNLGSRGFPYALSSLTDPRKVDDFSVCSAFDLLVGRSGDFQAPYMWNWKLVLDHLFKK